MATQNKTPKYVFNTDNRLYRSKVLQNAPMEHSAVLLTFSKLPPGFKTFILSIFEWQLKTGYTVYAKMKTSWPPDKSA